MEPRRFDRLYRVFNRGSTGRAACMKEETYDEWTIFLTFQRQASIAIHMERRRRELTRAFYRFRAIIIIAITAAFLFRPLANKNTQSRKRLKLLLPSLTLNRTRELRTANGC